MIVVTILLCLGLLHSGIGQDTAQCPQDFASLQDICYMVSTKVANWADAQTACQLLGGHLANVNSLDTQIYLAGYVEYVNKQSGVNVATGNDYVYHYLHDLGVDVTKATEVTFNVQACNDAHIALSRTKGVDVNETYEIVIGGWGDSMSVIRECKQCFNHNSTHGERPLSCTEQHPFWISWADGTIRVGHGNDIGSNQFMAWTDPTPYQVNYVAVATGWGSHGNWTFPQNTFMPGRFWVGATSSQDTGVWQWKPSGDLVDEFTDWSTGHPNGTIGHCMVMDMRSQMQWKTDMCTENRNYICETTSDAGSIVG